MEKLMMALSREEGLKRETQITAFLPDSLHGKAGRGGGA